ncbi:MAG TPA: lysophospholipid acyltransferase family protein [Candidatus Binataceae bacterium]|nr:lysophospholipid acyltransferase family protein [Candidatus Binataceae bacterium]
MAGEAEVSSYADGASRGIFNQAWGVLATLLCVLLTTVMAPMAAMSAAMSRYHAVTVLSRIWARTILTLCGVKVEVVGRQNLPGSGPCILVANHKSFFDIFAVAAHIPGEPRFVGKKELLKIPAIGYALQHSGHIVIDRQSGGKEIRKAVESIRRGFTVCVFAEGHRFNDNQLHEFNDGAAWLAILTKLPAVPLAISGSGTFMPRGAMVVRPGGTIRLTLGPAIATAGMKSADRTELTHKLEEQVRADFVAEI